MKEEVLPIYEALMGALSSAPLAEKVGYLFESSMWTQYHGFIDKLNKITGTSFDDYKLTIIPDQDWGDKISVQEYRTKLNTLIMELHGRFFSKDARPFSGEPDVVVSQSQNQSQNVQVMIITEIQDLIDKRLYGEKLEEEERSFLEKVKAELPNIRSVIELIQVILSLAKSSGMDATQILKSLGL